MRKLLILLYTLLFNTSVIAQTGPRTSISTSIDNLLSTKYVLNAPGISVLVAKDGNVIYNKAFGSANLELNVPMKADMLFNLGSITKQFTAVAILQLMEQGRLSLQDSIQKYIPNFSSKPHKISIENLLTHTSGLKDYLQMNYSDPYMIRRDFEPKEIIEYFKNELLEFNPGTRYMYSNSNYILLGYIIEIITGKTYENYLQENIFNVLGLKNTYCDNSSRIFPNRTYGYKKSTNYEKADYWGASIPYAAGTLISNTEDLLIWQNGLLDGKLLKKQTLEKAFMPFSLNDGTKINYGYGWMINTINGSLGISHGGAITGYRTIEVYYPEQGIYIVVLGNCDCTRTEELFTAISGIVIGKSSQTEFKQTDVVLNKYIGVYALTSNSKRKIKIAKENGSSCCLYFRKRILSTCFSIRLKFEFKDIYDAKCEFIVQNDKVLKFIVNQNGIFNWKKIE
ncbi:serine hydrolase domain-containing protein [Pedobacter sp. UC225_65]|uniref:serine hydrolase domain-containing protein n=1 Tax=Pedobacter sp. UC225_65 TaxID=3350173 RepID=UPI00366D9CEE